MFLFVSTLCAQAVSSFLLLTRANVFKIHDVRMLCSHLNCFSLEASNRRRGTGALLVDGSTAAAAVCLDLFLFLIFKILKLILMVSFHAFQASTYADIYL